MIKRRVFTSPGEIAEAFGWRSGAACSRLEAPVGLRSARLPVEGLRAGFLRIQPKRSARGYRLTRLRIALASLVLLLSTACGGWQGGKLYVARRGKGKREATYEVGLPGQGWKAHRREKSAQVAWHHEALPLLISVYSLCQEHGDASLESFTDHLRPDFRPWEILEEPTGELDAHGKARMRKRQHYLRVADREALRTSVKASLDGQPLRLELTVLKKNGCLFDFSYVAAPEAYESGLAAYEHVIDGFRFPVRGR